MIANKSGVVYNKDGKRLYGLDAELYRKMEQKEDSEWDGKVIQWIEAMLNEKLPSNDLWVCLKNGVLLCRLVNTIKPGMIVKYNKTRLVPLMEMGMGGMAEQFSYLIAPQITFIYSAKRVGDLESHPM